MEDSSEDELPATPIQATNGKGRKRKAEDSQEEESAAKTSKYNNFVKSGENNQVIIVYRYLAARETSIMLILT